MVSLKCKEILCVIYSGLLFISGIVLITFSVILSYRIFYHFNFVPSGTIGPFIIIFILGILHLFLSWLGVKGPTREHNFHIVMFMVFTLVLLVCEVAVGIWSMILWDEIAVQAIELMTVSFNEMINFDAKEWSKLQSDLKCCGLLGIQSYSSKGSTPISCINPELSNKTIQFIYEDGCQKPFVKYVKSILIDGALIGFISGIFQGLGIFMFYSYFSSLREERKERLNRRMAMQRQVSQSQVPLQNAPPYPTPPASANTVPLTVPLTTS